MRLFVWSLLIMCTQIVSNAEARPRLAILTDIGGDPDDQQSMVRLMVYSQEFEIEALIATASGTPGERYGQTYSGMRRVGLLQGTCSAS
jgi:hypothetical protein